MLLIEKVGVRIDGFGPPLPTKSNDVEGFSPRRHWSSCSIWRCFSYVDSKLLSSLLLQSCDQFVDILHSQVEMQRLVVLAQQMLRHMDSHSDARRIRTLRVFPLQLTQAMVPTACLSSHAR